ncbi:apolipoprotein N-acyltransferase [Vibrio sp. JCM 19236]|nr:apolipoprotein N-acyltransferase [Vibrio sp. JCM 19236]
MSIAGSIAYAVSNKKWKTLALPALIFLGGWLTHLATWVIPDQTRAQTVALVQGNVAQELKWLPSHRWPTMLKYMDHTRDNWDADIIIWPEAAIPAFEHEVPQFMETIDLQARDNDAAVITGVLTRDADGHFFNSVTTLGVNPNGPYDYNTQHRYQKHHLLPFGEFVPLEDILRPLAPFFNLPMSSFDRGDYIQDNIVLKGCTWWSLFAMK